MKSKSYSGRLARLFYHYVRRKERLPYKPVRLWIELTSHCNYACVMCPNTRLDKKDSGYMDYDLFTKIVDEAGEFAFDINLAHRGESLLHPRAAEMAAYAKSKNLFTRLHTNGSLLTEELSGRLLDARLDRLSFSFDGFDKATYERIRKKGDFDRTVGNIVRFLEMKKARGAKRPEAAIEVIRFNEPENPPDAAAERAFRARFRDLPLDSIVFKDLHNWAGDTAPSKRSGRYSVCPFPWNALVVFWDGRVFPCTQDFFGLTPIGDAGASGLADIWNGDPLRRLRSRLIDGSIDDIPTCGRCDRPWRPRFLGVPREYLWKFLRKRMP